MKKALILIFALASGIFLTCSDEPTDETADFIFHDVFNEVNEATKTAKSSPSQNVQQNIVITEPRNAQQINWQNSTGTINVTGTCTTNVNSEISCDLCINFTNHKTNNGTTISGTATNKITMNSINTAFSYDLGGELDIVYKGVTYDFSWDVQVNGTFNPQRYTITGGFYLNGVYYPAKL